MSCVWHCLPLPASILQRLAASRAPLASIALAATRCVACSLGLDRFCSDSLRRIASRHASHHYSRVRPICRSFDRTGRHPYVKHFSGYFNSYHARRKFASRIFSQFRRHLEGSWIWKSTVPNFVCSCISQDNMFEVQSSIPLTIIHERVFGTQAHLMHGQSSLQLLLCYKALLGEHQLQEIVQLL